MGRLRNSLRSDSPRRFLSAAQAEGAVRGLKVNTMRSLTNVGLYLGRHSRAGGNPVDFVEIQKTWILRFTQNNK